MSNKVIPAVLFGAVILLAGFFVLNAYIYDEKQAPVEQNFEPYVAKLMGEYVCLVSIADAVRDICELGIKTATGEYYAVDFATLPKEQEKFTIGDTFEAAGVVTPIERLSTDRWQQYGVKGIFTITGSLVVAEGEAPVPVACDGDAKLCPDGSSVGRSGPQCEFAACPSVEAASTTLTTYLGGTATGLSVSVNPTKVVSDSRCPATVTCVWAGTVEVETILSTPVSHGEHVLSLGKSQTFGDYTVTLTAVTPDKSEEAVPESSYRFTYTVVKNTKPVQ